MTGLEHVGWTEIDGARREARCEGRRWLRRFVLLRAAGPPLELRTGEDEESGLVVLSGTHDLEAGAGSWIQRGTRTSPFAGRPVALFLPPRTRFRTSGGRGELLLVCADRPPLPAAPPPAAETVRPLLPLAGSNKAFDRTTGAWRPLESFPDSPEAILPRRIARHDRGGATLELVFPLDYKTRSLCLTEAVLGVGGELSLPDPPPADGYPDEWAIYCRAEGELLVRAEHGAPDPVGGEAVLAGTGPVRVQARGGRAYLAIAYAGAKPTT